MFRHLQGRAAALIQSEDCNNGDNDDMGNSVYVFAGNVAPQDIQGNDNDPLTRGRENCTRAPTDRLPC